MTASLADFVRIPRSRPRPAIIDLAVGACILLVLVAIFARIELVELIFDATRDYEHLELDELIAAVPALTIVASWYSFRRWREAGHLNTQLQSSLDATRRAETERRAMETQLRQAQKLEAIGKLAGGLAHELNNMLQPIVTISQLGAKKEATPAETQARMGQILAAAEHGRTIVNDVLTFASGGSRSREDIVLSRAVAEAAELCREMLDESVRLQTKIVDDTGVAHLNRAELTQVVVNLVTNAADAIEHSGTIHLILETSDLNGNESQHFEVKPGSYFLLSVVDDGPGLSKDLKSKVFDPFFTTKDATRGTGLGLAVVHGMVRDWGGAVSLSSSPGAGATFTVLIPRKDAKSSMR